MSYWEEAFRFYSVKKMYKYSLFIIISFLIFNITVVSANDLTHLAGRIVLQVEENGEAWYISTDKLERYFLGRPKSAFDLMREKGIGITNIDLDKIPIDLDLISGFDTDKDGLPDELEKSIRTNHLSNDSDGDGFLDLEELQTNNNPRNKKPLFFDTDFINRNLGKIFLQVESRGEAWYVFPENGKRYYLGRPDDAFRIMRSLGLGISNNNLNDLTAASIDFDLKNFEIKIHNLVNKERSSFNLKPLALNEDLSGVAREHSQNLANENKNFTAIDTACSYPLIHHEGLDFGIYQNNRLENRNIKYFNMSGENIALLSSAAVNLMYKEGSIDPIIFKQCSEEQSVWDKNFKEEMEKDISEEDKISILQEEINKREKAFASTVHLEIGSTSWQTEDELAVRAVDGWMNSPGHRKNILKAEYDEAGMGVAYANSYVIITQVFIRRTDCGYEGAPCCEQGKYLVCYQPNTCVDSICQ